MLVYALATLVEKLVAYRLGKSLRAALCLTGSTCGATLRKHSRADVADVSSNANRHLYGYRNSEIVQGRNLRIIEEVFENTHIADHDIDEAFLLRVLGRSRYSN